MSLPPYPEESLPPPSPSPARPESTVALPQGFFARLDFFLQNPHEITCRLRDGKDLPTLIRMFFTLSIVNCAIYGGVMGGNNLLQGADMILWQKLALIITTGIKVPILFLLTLLIVLPPIYVSNSFSGARLSFMQVLATLLGSIALASTILASLATVALFFSLTTMSYDFIKLLHVGFFAYAGLSGILFLVRQLEGVTLIMKTPLHLQVAWLILYIFVGTQLAWVLRPFIASPNEPFQVLRSRSGSFYESVQHSAFLMITGKTEKPGPSPEKPSAREEGY
ncbi:hypothetical protein GC173_02475 [bacterium]|nr:hypothetical protein [bacterium]